ncbi:hypothetical protein BJ986_002251 [Phycicoccus badiiscoriae]|uniref:Uncharacterized protein n=1 Tax=Pedococcus badiiscoriae TaxID=642776 RepID=A0A852WLW0_9MICO|nr:hypothetical protein [Pedococcus badiiscoriae]NYG07764.1 hypothetical protein [Pedococcus badiiscoriae]
MNIFNAPAFRGGAPGRSQQQQSTWPEGFRRPKSESDWVAQFIWAALGVVGCIGFAASGLGFYAVGCLVVAIASCVWVEFQARCEDRALVWTAFGAIMILSVLGAMRNRRNSSPRP